MYTYALTPRAGKVHWWIRIRNICRQYPIKRNVKWST